MKKTIIQTPAYDVSGGDGNFDSLPFEGEKSIVCQVFQSSLNQADNKLRLQHSLDGVNFNNALDYNGDIIEIIISNSLGTTILSTYNFTTSYVRFQFIEGTAGTGTIDKLIIMSE